jgi:hypothetical protein
MLPEIAPHRIPTASRAASLTGSRKLFAIDWLRRGVRIERETSVLTDLDAVVVLTRQGS